MTARKQSFARKSAPQKGSRQALAKCPACGNRQTLALREEIKAVGGRRVGGGEFLACANCYSHGLIVRIRPEYPRAVY